MQQPRTDEHVEGHPPGHGTSIKGAGQAVGAGHVVPADRLPLRQFYELGDGEVDRFLREFPFLVDLLLEAAEPLHHYFGDATLMLELVDAPDVVSDQQLAIVIRASLSPEQLLERLRQFDAEWWLDRLPRAADRLFITLGFA